MRALLLVLLLMSPLRQVEHSYLQFSTIHHDIFPDYQNDNFQQRISWRKNIVTVANQSLNFFQLDLNFRVVLDEEYLRQYPAEFQQVVKQLVADCISLRDFVDNISGFLKSQVMYDDSGAPQDALAVLQRKTANCVGYSNLVHEFFNCAGIESQFVKGFYLKNNRSGMLTPIPHKWVEVTLANGYRFFYDPQHQSFTSGYILVQEDVDFKTIRRFQVRLIKKEVKMIN